MSRFRALTAITAAAFLLASGCSGSEEPKQGTKSSVTPPVSNARESGTTFTVKDGPASSSKPAPSPVPSDVASGEPLAKDALRPTDPGTYIYDEAGMRRFGGCGSDGPPPTPTTLKIDQANGNRQRSVRDRRGPNGQGDVVTSVFEFKPDGIYLVYLLQENFSPLGRNATEFAPESPILALSLDPKVTSWSFEITSKDGQTKYQAQNSVESRDDQVSIGSGESLSAVRIRREGRIVGQSIAGPIDFSEQNTSWVSTSSRLVLKEVVNLKGTAGTCQIDSHVESIIKTTKPS